MGSNPTRSTLRGIMDWWNKLLDIIFGTDEPDDKLKAEQDYQPPEHDDAFYISHFVRNKIEDAGGDPESAYMTHLAIAEESPLERPITDEDIRLQAYLNWEQDCISGAEIRSPDHYWYLAEEDLKSSQGNVNLLGMK